MVQLLPPRPVTAEQVQSMEAGFAPIAISPAPPTPAPPIGNNYAAAPAANGQNVDPNTVDILFEKDLPDELACPRCEQALRSATKLPCGHLYCQECLEGLPKCLVCASDIAPGSGKLDKNTMRKIQGLSVYCSWKDQGCEWKGTLKNLEEHALNCDFHEVVCNNGCGQIYAKKNEEQHLREECGRRGVVCENCSKEIPAKAMEIHRKLCPMARINCPNQCGLEGVTRQEIREHQALCPKRGNGCPFGEFGCNFAGEKESLQKHISQEPIRHLTYLCDGVVELKMLLAHMQVQMETMTGAMQELQLKGDLLEKLYGAQLVWRIDNFRQKLNEAKSGAKSTIFSTPFMSGRHGYKMICSVCPYGDGPGKLAEII
ncbi:unnamed protein product, partial [Mesorhabditis spiculigera]